MRWFDNRNREGHEAETSDVKAKNQIIQTPEKQTPEAKGKLDRWQDKSPEEQRESLNEQSQDAKERQKLERSSNASSEGATSKGQRQLELGHETERE